MFNAIDIIKIVIRLFLIVIVLATVAALLVIVVPSVTTAITHWNAQQVTGYGDLVPSSSPQYIYASMIGWMFGSWWIPVGAALLALVVYWLAVVALRLIGMVLDNIG